MTPAALDITVASIILLSTIVAYMRGIIKEMFTIFGVLMAVFVALKGGHLLIPAFNDWLHVPVSGTSDKKDYVLFGMLSPSMAAKAYSYLGTFLGVLLTMTLLGKMFASWVKSAGMEMVDKGLGGVFGFLRGFFVVFLLYIPFVYLVGVDKFPQWAKDSYSVASFGRTFTWMSKETNLEEKLKPTSEGLTIKFDKIDPSKLEEVKGLVKEQMKDQMKDNVDDAKAKLKEAIEKEEKDRKSDTPPAEVKPAAPSAPVETKEIAPQDAPKAVPADPAKANVIDKSGQLNN